METPIMKNDCSPCVFTIEKTRCLCLANQAIRHVRARVGHLAISRMDIDGQRPLIHLDAPPPALLLDAAQGLHSHQQDDRSYLVRCKAFEVDWIWVSGGPVVHRRADVTQATAAPDNLVYPEFSSRLFIDFKGRRQ